MSLQKNHQFTHRHTHTPQAYTYISYYVLSSTYIDNVYVRIYGHQGQCATLLPKIMQYSLINNQQPRTVWRTDCVKIDYTYIFTQ